MKRFQMELPLMIRRWRQEWQAHGRNFGNCHCGLGMGTMRKHKVYESHPSSSCRLCAAERDGRRAERRKQRHEARVAIEDGLREALQQIIAVKDIGADFPDASGKYVNDSAGERDMMYRIATDAVAAFPADDCPRCGQPIIQKGKI